MLKEVQILESQQLDMRVLTWNVRGLHNLRLQLQTSMSSLLESLQAGTLGGLLYTL